MVSVCVVGAGIVGLSTAVCIQKAIPHALVTIVADKFLKGTTSDVAAGVYRFSGPIFVAGRPASAGREIAQLSWDWLSSLEQSAESAMSGVIRLSGYDVAYPGIPDSQDIPQYLEHVYSYNKLTSDELRRAFPSLPHGCSGWFSTTLLVECRTYLPWLTARFTKSGGRTIEQRVDSFNELFDTYSIVVNCAGLGAGALTGDAGLYPIRGQMTRVDAKEIKHFLYVDDGSDRPTYIYPTLGTVALGGTKQERNSNLDLSATDREHIIRSCSRFMPSLAFAKVLGQVVGLRPHRSSLRICTETVLHKGQPRQVVHNYGHGGNGVAWSWGSAVLAARLVTEAAPAANLAIGGSKVLASSLPATVSKL